MNAQSYTDVIETWSRPAKAAFDFWVSFWPVAPAFGVEWRFNDVVMRAMPGDVPAGFSREPAKPTTKPRAASVEDAVVVHHPAARKPAPDPEPTPAAEPAPKAPVSGKPAGDAPAEPGIDAGAVADDLAGMVSAGTETSAAALDTALPSKPEGLYDAAPDEVHDLKLIRGIGPSLERQLNGLGVYRFEQIAEFSDGDLAWIDDNLTSFKGRCFRDDWVGQARAQLG